MKAHSDTAPTYPGAINGETFEQFVTRVWDMAIRGKGQWLREDLKKFADNHASCFAAVREKEIGGLRESLMAILVLYRAHASDMDLVAR
jgi:hypothetical protein